VRWSKLGEEMTGAWADDFGRHLFNMIMRPGARPGELSVTIPEGAYQAEYRGKITAKGPLRLQQQGKVFGPFVFTFEMIEPGIFRWMGPNVVSYDGQLAYRVADGWGATPDRSVWGVYLDLIGRTWLLKRPDGTATKAKFGWLVPGKVLYEFLYGPDGEIAASRQVRLAPNGKLMSINPYVAYHHEAEGTVNADGSIQFASLKMKSLGRKWSYHVRPDGYIGSREDLSASAQADAVFVPLSPEQEQRLQAAHDAQRADEIQARRERLHRFNDAMGAVGSALQSAQVEADISEARSRAELDATLARIEARSESTAPTEQDALGSADNETAVSEDRFDRSAPVDAPAHAAVTHPTRECREYEEEYPMGSLLENSRERALEGLMSQPNSERFTDVECKQMIAPSFGNKNGMWKCSAKLPSGIIRKVCEGSAASKQ
jgi:hypothetical protein